VKDRAGVETLIDVFQELRHGERCALAFNSMVKLPNEVTTCTCTLCTCGLPAGWAPLPCGAEAAEEAPAARRQKQR